MYSIQQIEHDDVEWNKLDDSSLQVHKPSFSVMKQLEELLLLPRWCRQGVLLFPPKLVGSPSQDTQHDVTVVHHRIPNTK